MLTKRVKARIVFLIIALFAASIIIFFILKSLEKNVVYFLSPSEIYNTENISFNKKIRIGCLVKENSIKKKRRKNKFYNY